MIQEEQQPMQQQHADTLLGRCMSGYSIGLAPMRMLRCRYGVDSAQKHRSALFSLLCGLFHSKMAAVSWRQLENVSATLLDLKKLYKLQQIMSRVCLHKQLLNL